MTQPQLTAIEDRIYGETPEEGLIARVYGDPELATVFAASRDLLAALQKLVAEYDSIEPGEITNVACIVAFMVQDFLPQARAAIDKAT